jgi:hypothetical protein
MYTIDTCFWPALNYKIRPVHLRRKVGFRTVITVPTVITPYSTVQITIGQSTLSDRTRRCHLTVQLWPLFGCLAPILAQNTIFKPEIKYCVQLWVSMQATAGPFPRAEAAPTQPQDRSGKHCETSARERSMLEVEMGVLGWRGLSEAIFALAVPAWHRSVPRTVNYHNYGKLRSSKIVITP